MGIQKVDLNSFEQIYNETYANILKYVICKCSNLEDYVLNGIHTSEIWEFIKKKKVIIGRIFYLYYSLDMTIKDISEELKINESTIKNHLYRTLKELNTAFKKESD